MNIAMIGPGNVGTTSIRRLARSGHVVSIANSRGPDSLKELAAETAPVLHLSAGLSWMRTSSSIQMAVRRTDCSLVAITLGCATTRQPPMPPSCASKLFATTEVPPDSGGWLRGLKVRGQ